VYVRKPRAGEHENGLDRLLHALLGMKPDELVSDVGLREHMHRLPIRGRLGDQQRRVFALVRTGR
jgi:hypothetical protein